MSLPSSRQGFDSFFTRCMAINKRVEFFLNFAKNTQDSVLRRKYFEIGYRIYLKCRSTKSKLKNYGVSFCKICFEDSHSKRTCPMNQVNINKT